MTRPCAKPGCPVLVEDLPNRVFCYEHTEEQLWEYAHARRVSEVKLAAVDAMRHRMTAESEKHRLQLKTAEPAITRGQAFSKTQAEKVRIRHKFTHGVHDAWREELRRRREKGEARAAIIREIASREQVTRRHVQKVMEGIA